MAYIEYIANFLGTNELGVIVVFLFGYLLLRYILDKDIKKFHEIDKIIFGITIGIVSFIILEILFMLFFEYINLLFYLKISYDGLQYTSMLYIMFIFSIVSLSLVFKELYTIVITTKHNISNKNKIKKLQKPIHDLLILFSFISIIYFIICFISYFTIINLISIELLKISLFFSFITLVIYNYYCIIHRKDIDKNFSSKLKKIKKDILLKKKIIIIISIMFILFFIFPNIEYSSEINTNYAYDTELPWLSNGHINLLEVYYFKKIEQPILIKRQGLLKWIPIENKEDLIYNTSIKEFKNINPLYLNIDIKNKYNLNDAGIINKTFNKKLNSFIIEFNKLNKNYIESITLIGYKKINLDKYSLNISLDVDTPNKIKLNMTNNLDKPIELLKTKKIKSLKTNTPCSLSQERFKTYYKKEYIPPSTTATNDYNTTISLNSKSSKNIQSNNINFEIKDTDNNILLRDFKINPNTRIEIILNINCKQT